MLIKYNNKGGISMYYYGYSGGYNSNPCCPGYGYPVPAYTNNNNQGYGAAIILVLFILLVIVIGARAFNIN